MAIFNPVTYNEFVSRMIDHGCIVTGSPQIHLHHVLGRKARFNKQPVGKWYQLPIWYKLHDNSNHPFSVTSAKKAFELKYGTQKELFIKLCSNVNAYPPLEIYNAIVSYK